MNTRPLPAIIMLSAGAVTCFAGIFTGMEFKDFLKLLLIVLIAFYIAGGIIKMILDKNFKHMGAEEILQQVTEEENAVENIEQEELEKTEETTAKTETEEQ